MTGKTKPLNLYLLEQDENDGWDTYSACIVCAESVEDAKTIDPDGNDFVENEEKHYSWAKTRKGIKCTKIGVATVEMERDVVLASFHAG